MKVNKSRVILFLFLIIAPLFCSCITILTDLGTAAVGYSPDVVDKYTKTLDPNVHYSKRSAILLASMDNPKPLEKFGDIDADKVSKAMLANSGKHTFEVSISSDNCEIPAYLVFPDSYEKSRKYPVLIYAHGGGFELWSFAQYATFCLELANEIDCCVLFYEYRKAPQYKFPAGVNDSYATLKWLLDDNNAAKWGLDNKHYALAGDSSGGNFVSGLAIRAAEEGLPNAKAVWLVYPSVDVSTRFNYSRLAFGGLEKGGKGHYLTPFDYLVSVQNKYLEDPSDAYKPYASPLIMLEGLIDCEGFKENPLKQYSAKLELPLKNFPPHLIAVVEADTLRDEGKSYYAVLKILGAEATLEEYKGVFHSFILFDQFFNQAERAISSGTAFIKSSFNKK